MERVTRLKVYADPASRTSETAAPQGPPIEFRACMREPNPDCPPARFARLDSP